MACLNHFFEKIQQQISAKTNVNANTRNCDLWLGATTSDGLYGRKQVTFPDGSRKLMRISRVIYMIRHKILIIPTVNDAGNALEMSHLCHNSLCVNSDHINLEPKAVNLERKHCVNQDSCTQNHNPYCIL